MASPRPRSASTGGWMPRTRARSSARALTEESRASASSARAASGLVSMICPAASRVMPMATSRACAPSCRSRSIRRISAAPVSRASLRVCDRWRTRRASSAWPDGARMARGQQAVTAQQPRRRRHPRGHHRAADDGQDRLGVPGEGGRRDRARYHRDQERHPAHHDQRRGGDGQDPPDQGVHRHPEQVPPGRHVAEQPPQARGVVQLGRVRGRRLDTTRRWARRTTRRPAAGSARPAGAGPAARGARRTGRWRAQRSGTAGAAGSAGGRPRGPPGRSRSRPRPGAPIPPAPAPARPRPPSARRSPGHSTRRSGTTRGRAGACCARAGCQ